MIRVAAVGDIHLGEDSGMQLRPAFDDIDQHADILFTGRRSHENGNRRGGDDGGWRIRRTSGAGGGGIG